MIRLRRAARNVLNMFIIGLRRYLCRLSFRFGEDAPVAGRYQRHDKKTKTKTMWESFRFSCIQYLTGAARRSARALALRCSQTHDSWTRSNRTTRANTYNKPKNNNFVFNDVHDDLVVIWRLLLGHNRAHCQTHTHVHRSRHLNYPSRERASSLCI